MEETKQRLKVYCETSFWSYLTGRPSAVQKTAYWQSLTRIWWSEESSKYDVYVSQHVLSEASDVDPELARRRIEACKGMHVLLTWNCKHMANRFVLPKTVKVVNEAGYSCPAIVTPENFLKEELE